MSKDSGLNSLIRDLVDPEVPLAACLRKARVLAEFVDNEELASWLESELHGYDSAADLPSYRKIKARAKGMFMLPGLRKGAELAIATSAIPEEYRENLTTTVLMESIGAVEALARSEGKGLQSPWEPVAYQFAKPAITSPLGSPVCYSAWREMSVHVVTNVLEVVRNRLLSLCLDLARHDDSVNAQSLLGSAPPSLESDEVSKFVSLHITGGSHNIAVGNGVSQVHLGGVVAGDSGSLILALKGLGISDSALSELQNQLHEDNEPERGSLPLSVLSWIPKATASLVKEGAKTVAAEATKMLLAYYGLLGGN